MHTVGSVDDDDDDDDDDDILLVAVRSEKTPN